MRIKYQITYKKQDGHSGEEYFTGDQVSLRDAPHTVFDLIAGTPFVDPDSFV